MAKKNILTYTWLTQYISGVARKREGRIIPVLNQRIGTENVTGHKDITVEALSGGQMFGLYWKSRYMFATIEPIIHGGKVYSMYRPHFSATRWRKSMEHCLPVSLPEGAKFDEDRPVHYLNRNGSFNCGGRYIDLGERRNGRKKGRFCKNAAIDDATGEFVDLQNEAVNYEHPSAYSDIRTGFIPGACSTAKEWLGTMDHQGIRAANWEYEDGVHKFRCDGLSQAPLWDNEALKALATKVLRAAREFISNAPHVKVAGIPAMFTNRHAVPFSFSDDRFPFASAYAESRDYLVVGHDPDGRAICWMPPQLVLYWTVPGDGYRAKPAWVRFIKVTVPPVGCEYLEKDQWNTPSNTEVTYSDLTDDMTCSQAYRSRRVPARAYHGLMAFTQRRPMDRQWRSRPTLSGEAAEANAYYKWSKNSAVVLVSDRHDLGWPGKAETPFACNYVTPPERAFSLYEEAAILDAIPAC